MNPRKILISYDPASGDIQIQNDFESPVLMLGVIDLARLSIAAKIMSPPPGGRVIPARFNGVPPVPPTGAG